MSSERILDIGCGKTNHLGLYSRPDVSIVGCDLRKDFLEYRTRIESDGEFLVADGHSLPYADLSFNEVFLAGALEHVTEPKMVLDEAFRVLKPEGKLILDVPHPRYEKVMSRIAPEYHDDGLHKHTFQPKEIQELVKKTGFVIEECSPRMWKAASHFSWRWLRARLEGKLRFDPDNGELLDYPENDKSNLSEWFDKLLWLSENKSASPKRFYLLSPLRLLNQLYPWMTYIEARKKTSLSNEASF